jgi:tetratricopeptide (TPR) repeat protein
VLSGRLPPLVSPYAPRQETGLSLVNLPPGQVTVLATADDAAFQRSPGAGGTGKTYLAASVARAHLADRAAHLVVWVAAATQDAVIRGYAQALSDIGLADPADGVERTAARFLEWLAGTDLPWLVVLDDLNDLGAVEDWWPQGTAGHVLVTTERPDICQRYNPRFVRVGGFSPREALWYLSERLRSDHDQRTGATDLAIELGFLPLALAQAAAVMTETGLSCRRYLALAAERKPKPDGDPATVHPSAAVTYALSAQLARELPPVGLAGRALSLISMLGPHGIPAAVLTGRVARTYLAGGGAFPIDRNQAWTAVQNLAAAGLVAIEADSAARTVLAHTLVQALARQDLCAAERESAVRAAADALTEIWSSQTMPADVEPSLRDCAAWRGEAGGAILWTPQCHPVLLRLGESLTSSGLTDQAVAYWRTMLSISERHLGAGHDQTARFRDLLGAAYELAGRTDEAVAMYEDLLSYLEKTEAGCHPDILAARSSLARGYLAAGRQSDALRLTSQTVTECERALGVDHPGTLSARASLATAYRSAGKLKDAIKQYERTLAARERLQGATDPDTIATRRDLAFAACLAGKYAYSVKQYERALTDSRQVFGSGHPLTLGLQEDLDAVAGQARARHGIDLRTPQSR